MNTKNIMFLHDKVHTYFLKKYVYTFCCGYIDVNVIKVVLRADYATSEQICINATSHIIRVVLLLCLDRAVRV